MPMFIIVKAGNSNRKVNSQVFGEIRRFMPRLPMFFKSLGTDSALLTTVWQMYATALYSGMLPTASKEQLAYYAADASQCRYAKDFHSALYNSLNISAIKSHETLPSVAHTEEQRRHLIHFVHKLARQFGAMNNVDAAQFSDVFRTNPDRLEALVIISLVIFESRFADALGVELEFVPEESALRRNTMDAFARQARAKRLKRYTPTDIDLKALTSQTKEFYKDNFSAEPPAFYTAFGHIPALAGAYLPFEMMLLRPNALSPSLTRRIARFTTSLVYPEDAILQTMRKGWSDIEPLENESKLYALIKHIAMEPHKISAEQYNKLSPAYSGDQLFDAATTAAIAIARACFHKAATVIF